MGQKREAPCSETCPAMMIDRTPVPRAGAGRAAGDKRVEEKAREDSGQLALVVVLGEIAADDQQRPA